MRYIRRRAHARTHLCLQPPKKPAGVPHRRRPSSLHTPPPAPSRHRVSVVLLTMHGTPLAPATVRVFPSRSHRRRRRRYGFPHRRLSRRSVCRRNLAGKEAADFRRECFSRTAPVGRGLLWLLLYLIYTNMTVFPNDFAIFFSPFFIISVPWR